MATALATSLAQRPAALVSVRGRQRAVSVTARAAKGKTAAQQAYVCVDCGWIYDGREPFDKLPNSYRCPVCNAPKRRFRATAAKGSNDAAGMRKRYDAMQRGADDGVLDENDKSFFIAAAVGGAVLLGGLYAYLSATTAL